MTRRLTTFLLSILAAGRVAGGATLPGFHVQKLGGVSGFASSIAVDSHDTIYYTTTAGDLFRFEAGHSALVAHVNTVGAGDSGLLGMALRDDDTAVVHYTTPNQVSDVISSIDLRTGAETILHELIDDISMPGRPTPTEHHGGNPTVGADGSIFVGIGDFGGGAIAALPEWNGGKIFRILPDGTLVQFARGFRNPFDMSWDAAHGRLIATDNGVAVDDEINIVTEGGYYGWPYTTGNEPPVEGATPPLYVFPQIVAPTGLVALHGTNRVLRRGYLLGAFVTKAIYYVPDIDARPLPDPLPLISGETSFVIDVTESAGGRIFFCTGNAIYELLVPLLGDCNGDGLLNAADLDALRLEIADGPRPITDAQKGGAHGSFGCDANGDGVIDVQDVAALAKLLGVRPRPVRVSGRS